MLLLHLRIVRVLINQIDYDGKLVNLCEGDIYDEENVFSIIIGVNASGKSRLLAKICNIFLSTKERIKYIYPLSDLSKKKFCREKYISKQYCEIGSIKYKNNSNNNYIEYSYSNTEVDLYEYSKQNSSDFDVVFKVNDNYCLVDVPEKIITVSNSLFDKFPEVLNKELRDFYINKGSSCFNERYDSKLNLNIIKTRQISNSILNLVVSKYDFIEDVLYSLNIECNLEFKLKLKLKTSNSIRGEMYNIDNTILSLIKFKYDRNNELLMMKKIRKHFQLFLTLCYGRGDIHNLKFDYKKEFENKDITFKYNKNDKNGDLLEAVKELLSIGLISVNDVLFCSGRNKVSVSEKSSGELCYLHMVTAISSEIKNNSIILIDEPELSLHPRWQSEFIPFIQKLFKKYKGCHFICATHSPHIVSSLSGNNTFVTNISYKPLVPIKGTDVHHKSMDYQISRVFGMDNPNNEYLIRIALNLFTYISKYKMLNDEKREEYKFLLDISEHMDKSSPLYDLILTLKEMNEVYG